MKAKKQTKDARMQSPIANIKVVGVGGGGGNAVSRMNSGGMRGVQFIAVNTDHQDLDHCEVRHKLYIGRNLTRGLGTGMNPDLGRQAAEENRSEIAEAVKGADIVFVAAGLGGGTGSGASPVVAEAAKQSGALTLAFVTKPFSFEGSQRQRIAEEGLMKLKDKVDALIVVPNDRIFSIIEKDMPVLKAFEAIDAVLKDSLEGIVDLIMSPGIINVDFADVRTVIEEAGSAIVGVGLASGQDRAVAAVQQALHSPLLEVNPEGARGVLLGISGGKDLKMSEINDAAKLVAQTVDPGAKIIFGAYYDRKLKPGQIKITLVATGFNGPGGQASSLFGGYFEHNKPGFFSGEKRPPMYDDSGKTKQGEPPSAGSAGQKERAKEDAAKSPAATDVMGAQGKEKPKEEKKTDGDAWDIPAFLRRRKR